MIRSSILRALVPVACLLVSLATPASAQSPPSSASVPQAAPVSAEELERLVGTLQDDQARAKLIEQLRGLIAAQRGVEEKQAEENPATLLNNLSAEIDAISGEILAAAGVILDAPRLITWVQAQASRSEARALWLDVGTKLGIIFGAAVLVEWLLRLLLRRPAARLGTRSSDSVAVQLLLLLSWCPGLLKNALRNITFFC